MTMLIHDDILEWEGFGGVYQLGSGKCRLRIFDLSKASAAKVAHLKPIIVVVSDLPELNAASLKQVSVSSCASHVATTVAARFNIAPHRMTYVEYHAPSTYGERNQFKIDAKYDVVDFQWFGNKALHPKWRSLSEPLRDLVAQAISDTQTVDSSVVGSEQF